MNLLTDEEICQSACDTACEAFEAGEFNKCAHHDGAKRAAQAQMKANARVLLSITGTNPNNLPYVSVTFTAEVVEDLKKDGGGMNGKGNLQQTYL